MGPLRKPYIACLANTRDPSCTQNAHVFPNRSPSPNVTAWERSSRRPVNSHSGAAVLIGANATGRSADRTERPLLAAAQASHSPNVIRLRKRYSAQPGYRKRTAAAHCSGCHPLLRRLSPSVGYVTFLLSFTPPACLFLSPERRRFVNYSASY